MIHYHLYLNELQEEEKQTKSERKEREEEIPFAENRYPKQQRLGQLRTRSREPCVPRVCDRGLNICLSLVCFTGTLAIKWIKSGLFGI